MEAESVVLGEGKATMDLRRIDPRRRLWVVTGGTVGVVGDVVRLPDVGDFDPGDCPQGVSPFDVEIVVDSVTREVILSESGRPKSQLERAMRLVRVLDAAGLPEQAQIVRDWLRDRWEEDLRERRAA